MVFTFNHERPLVMGIVNITPDSFSDGGKLFSDNHPDLDKVLFCAESLIDQGADILDIGGESTRPGACQISATEELERVLPVVAALSRRFDIPLSVDTSSPLVMRSAAQEGAGMINDIRALRFPGALEAAAACGLSVVLMHMQGDPQTMQESPAYGDVVGEVQDFLHARVAACESAGIDRNKIILDPGFGFGKTFAHNLSLVQGLPKIVASGMPVMAGFSRKGMIGQITGKKVDDRGYGSVAAALLAVQKGVSIIRVHDVAGTVDALKIMASFTDNGNAVFGGA